MNNKMMISYNQHLDLVVIGRPEGRLAIINGKSFPTHVPHISNSAEKIKCERCTPAYSSIFAPMSNADTNTRVNFNTKRHSKIQCGSSCKLKAGSAQAVFFVMRGKNE